METTIIEIIVTIGLFLAVVLAISLHQVDKKVKLTQNKKLK